MDDTPRRNGLPSGGDLLSEADEEGIVPGSSGATDAALICPLVPNDDSALTCIICTQTQCSWAIIVYGPGCTIWAGLHDRCGRVHSRRVAKLGLSSDPVEATAAFEEYRVAVYCQLDGEWALEGLGPGGVLGLARPWSLAWFSAAELALAQRYRDYMATEERTGGPITSDDSLTVYDSGSRPGKTITAVRHRPGDAFIPMPTMRELRHFPEGHAYSGYEYYFRLASGAEAAPVAR